MPMIDRAALGAAVLVLGTAISASSQQGAQGPPSPGEGMPEGPGKDVTVRACSPCHEALRSASLRLTRDGWAAVIEGMVKRGAKVSDDDFPIVLDYLSTHFLGEAARPINVNTAPQIDLESGAGLLRREAAAVVQYREKNGPFRTLEDMKNVPGLDFSKIDSRRDFLIAMEPSPPAPATAPQPR
jgi:competence protein ComEA